jgi:hypothetical protein
MAMRRLGTSPRERGSLDNGTCPDVFELDDGSFAVIGEHVTELDGYEIPPGHTAVILTRQTLLDAKKDIG